MGILGTILFNLRNMKKAKKLHSMSKEQLLALDDDAFYDALFTVTYDAVFDINEPGLPAELINVFSLIQFEMEVNNGGLCQFFVNSSRDCAPYVSQALQEAGAHGLKELFDGFITANGINVHDLSSFTVEKVEDYEAQTERYDFDSFDDRFYEDGDLHLQIIDYARRNLDKIFR